MYAQALDLDDLESRHGAYSGTRAYARAKRAQTALMREWARRLRPDAIACMAMHPGWADTPGLAEALPAFHRLMRQLLRTPAEGVDTIAWMAALPDPAAASGRLFLDRRARPFDRVPGTRLTLGDRRRLWDRVVELTGGVDPVPEKMTRCSGDRPAAAGMLSTPPEQIPLASSPGLSSSRLPSRRVGIGPEVLPSATVLAPTAVVDAARVAT
jgi:hypothetical protein